MRKFFTIVLMLAAYISGAFAQKYACVNTEYIFANIPDYAAAETQLNKLASDWQKEIEAKFVDIDKLYKTYQQEAYLLPDNLKRKREEDIVSKEKEAKELQRKRFGSGGDLDKKRAELMKPIQDRVYSAIERVANEKNYVFVFDRAGSNTVLFANAKYDLSDQVLDLLGYSKSTASDTDAAGKTGNLGENPVKKKSVDNPEMRRPADSKPQFPRN